MLIMQIIGSTVIFSRYLVTREGPAEPVFAVYLTFIILVVSGFVFPKGILRVCVMAVKAAACVLLLPLTPLPLFLIPPVGLELITLPGSNTGFPVLPLCCSAVTLAPVFLLPESMVILFLGFWALSVFIALTDRHNRETRERLTGRLRGLEKELAASEARGASLKKSGADQELLIKLQERDRIAQELHDQLGHTITGSIMQLEAAGMIFREDPDRVREIIGTVSRILREGLSSIRMSLKAIKPEPSRLGLNNLRRMMDDFETEHGIPTDLTTEGPVQTLPAGLWAVLESNLRESLTNMLKHSSGSRFSCTITVLNRVYRVEFRDNGSVPSPIGRGMGLEGMESRTREAGGTLIIDTSRGFSTIMLFEKGET